MRSSSTIVITTGEPGSGKSYDRVVYLITDFLTWDKQGKIFTNLPLRVGECVEYLVKKGINTEEEARERFHLIPDEVQLNWHNGVGGPWEYFAEYDLSHSHIIIDEVHEFCDVKVSADIHRKWGDWLGTFRHEGATCELMTQFIGRIPSSIWGSWNKTRLL